MMNRSEIKRLRRDTALLYAGGHVDIEGSSPESPGIYMSTAFVLEDLTALLHAQQNGGYMYTRDYSPNHICLEELVAYLEEGEACVCTSSGMAAIFCGLLSLVKGGDHVLANAALYGETYDLLENVLCDYGIETTFVDFNDPAAVEAAVRPNTRLFYTEIVANPLTVVVDIDRITETAHKHGARVMVDNTFTPGIITPLTHGVDMVVHSLTKYINGHFDVTGGAIITSRELITRAKYFMTLFGSSLGPMEAWLALRGARTLDLRLAKQFDNAAKLAEALSKHPKIQAVHHPSLPTHPQHELASRMFSGGYGAMLSFAMDNTWEKANRFIKALRVIQFVPTLGGYKTTLSHPTSTSHKDLSEEVRLQMGIHDGLIRMSVGMENPEDLIADIFQALEEPERKE